MSFVIDTTQKPKYPPIPENQYQAVLAEVVDFGEIQERFDDFPKHKLMFVFELNALRDDGKRHYVKTFKINATMNEKGTLRKNYLDKMLGAQKMNEILAQPQFDLASLVGTNCVIEVVHDVTGQYANIGSIMRYFGSEPINVSADYVPWKERPGYVDPPRVEQSPEQVAAIQQVEQTRQQMQAQQAPVVAAAASQPMTTDDLTVLMNLGAAAWGNAAMQKVGQTAHSMFGKDMMQLTKDEAAQLIDRIRAVASKPAANIAAQTAVPATNGGASVRGAGDSVGDGGYDPFAEPGEPGYREEGHPDIAAFHAQEEAVTA